ncbi:hypothetical protein QYF36_024109 [Acer negundo]|nr:hypothetical protein QYF36_024109 [Acer negundo]
MEKKSILMVHSLELRDQRVVPPFKPRGGCSIPLSTQIIAGSRIEMTEEVNNLGSNGTTMEAINDEIQMGFAGSSEKHCGKRKSNSEENEEAYGRRKARRLDGISAIEDSICKDKSERISGGEVTNTLVSPTEDDALEAIESAGRSSLARRSQ